jgi:hypothetical protein
MTCARWDCRSGQSRDLGRGDICRAGPDWLAEGKGVVCIDDVVVARHR